MLRNGSFVVVTVVTYTINRHIFTVHIFTVFIVELSPNFHPKQSSASPFILYIHRCHKILYLCLDLIVFLSTIFFVKYLNSPNESNCYSTIVFSTACKKPHSHKHTHFNRTLRKITLNMNATALMRGSPK